ncbi:hypothetical protein R9X49_15660 [Pectobacterium carotovorum]|uniref:hypothetical protein n=1 Tax=Pectobacterium carotovorum TaxID=554 RepID=UPI0029D447AA|nr:hypothetical protein [Pectobacterium carotovorum]MDX6916546.1 hypothetical protein [Pectobacterium carotovorum]
MANKKELAMLKKALSCEIRGVAFQSKAALADKLFNDGLLELKKESQQTPYGLMTWEHYVLTHAGRIACGESCEGKGVVE